MVTVVDRTSKIDLNQIVSPRCPFSRKKVEVSVLKQEMSDNARLVLSNLQRHSAEFDVPITRSTLRSRVLRYGFDESSDGLGVSIADVDIPEERKWAEVDKVVEELWRAGIVTVDGPWVKVHLA